KQIQAQDIDHLKNQELWLVEQLWAKYSRGHFGFTAQLKQWQSIGGRLFYEPDEYWRFAETYLQFSSRLQWRKWSWFPIPFLSQKWRSYDKLIFNLTAPQGHLPSFLYWEGCNITDALLAKIKQCISLFAESN
ncbi:MAG: GUN4 domain-containing protein, partial [Pseudanabaena sp. ELA607]